MSNELDQALASTWMIGAGNMGQALISGWHRAGLSTGMMRVMDPREPMLPDNRQANASLPDQGCPDVVVLAVKPQMLGPVAQTLAGRLGAETKVISILAGTSVEKLRQALQAEQVVRVMPNLAAAIGKSATAAYAPPNADNRFKSLVDKLMNPIGSVEWLSLEEHLNAATALAGCGPAFFFRFIDALTAGALQLGIPEQQAQRLAIAMAEGASETLKRDGRDPAQLAEAVASEGGATRAGLKLLDAGDQLTHLLFRTLEASAERSRELSEP